MRVKDVMTTRVVAVRKGATFKEIAALLAEYRVSGFPVVDEDNKVIGVDVLSVYRRPDQEIRREILENVILNEFFADPDRFEVIVSSGELACITPAPPVPAPRDSRLACYRGEPAPDRESDLPSL